MVPVDLAAPSALANPSALVDLELLAALADRLGLVGLPAPAHRALRQLLLGPSALDLLGARTGLEGLGKGRTAPRSKAA